MDISHIWGSDLSLGPGGDVARVTGTEEGRQRVLRRLLTALTNYWWHLDYGCGLPGMVGNPVDVGAIEGIVRQQMALESCVSATPEPTVTVTSDDAGGVSLQISYIDASTGQQAALGPSDGLTFGGS